jgi:hypothetical protein
VRVLYCFGMLPRVFLFSSFLWGFLFETAEFIPHYLDRSVDPSPEVLIPLLYANVCYSFFLTYWLAERRIYRTFFSPMSCEYPS